MRQRDIKIEECDCEVCGKTAEVVHHENYSNPYEIMYLCKKCHYNLHKLLNRSMLTKWKNENQLTWEELAKKIGITRGALNDIVVTRSPNIKVITALKIREVTGLEPHQYLDGLETIKFITESRDGK